MRAHGFALGAALASFAVSAVYAFYLVPLHDFLYSDMLGFWRRAIDRLNGGTFSESQFVAWPPLYHIFLAETFRMFQSVGLSGWVRLETALAINMVAFAVSVFAFHQVAVRWFDRGFLAKLATGLYAFGFPSIYLNAFLLSENLAMPLLVMAVALAVCGKSWPSVVASAVLFGCGALIRPSIGPFGLAFVGLFWFRHGLRGRFFGQAAVFTAVFFAIIFAGMAEVSRISKGKVNGLSANGGLDFFIAQTHYHRVDLNYDGWHWFIVVPAYSHKAENGFFQTTVPFYQQDFYYRQGWEYLKKHPERLWQNLAHVKNVFFARMLPNRKDALGYTWLMPAWHVFKFVMFLALGLYVWAWSRLGDRKPECVLFGTILGLTLFVSYIFTGEPRYTLAILFVFYLLFLKLVDVALAHPGSWVRPAIRYGAVVILVAAAGLSVNAAVEREYGRTVQFEWKPAAQENVARTTFQAGRVIFPFRSQPGLRHVAITHPPFEGEGMVRARTLMEVRKPARPLQFEVSSAYPFELWVDGELALERSAFDYFASHDAMMELPPGLHEVEVRCHLAPREGGFAVSYSFWDGDVRRREPLGAASDAVRFHCPPDHAAEVATNP